MIDPGWIREGMTVRDLEGRKLGTVANLEAMQFEVEQGWPAQRDYVVKVRAVARIDGQDIILTRSPGVRALPED
ncbi:MAG TPA: DUF2171 domain-containing protein [Myxococcaceae bacterium]|jgi:hypothetical protein